MLEAPLITVRHRGLVWTMKPLTVAQTWITMQVRDKKINMPCSVLEFSLWDATCKQIPDMQLSSSAILALTDWLEAQHFKWRLGWSRPKTKTEKRQTDPRQLKLFDD